MPMRVSEGGIIPPMISSDGNRRSFPVPTKALESQSPGDERDRNTASETLALASEWMSGFMPPGGDVFSKMNIMSMGSSKSASQGPIPYLPAGEPPWRGEELPDWGGDVWTERQGQVYAEHLTLCGYTLVIRRTRVRLPENSHARPPSRGKYPIMSTCPAHYPSLCFTQVPLPRQGECTMPAPAREALLPPRAGRAEASPDREHDGRFCGVPHHALLQEQNLGCFQGPGRDAERRDLLGVPHRHGRWAGPAVPGGVEAGGGLLGEPPSHCGAAVACTPPPSREHPRKLSPAPGE